MPIINVNFNEVPDEIMPVDPGIYEAEITEVPIIVETQKKTGHNLRVNMKITTENSPMNGRTVRDSIFMNRIGNTKIKNLCNSAGIPVGEDGLDTEDLLGKIVTIEVGHRTFTTDGGEERNFAEVRKYIIINEV